MLMRRLIGGYSLALLLAFKPALGELPVCLAGRLNKPRSEDPIQVKKPNPVSKAYWSPNGSASADGVTTSIGTSMMKWSVGIGVGTAIAVLIFGSSGDTDNGGGGNGHSHSHSHSH